jgi:hypothetical protein
MLAEVFSSQQFLHLFPSLFALLLCLMSRLDRHWIDWKLDRELPAGMDRNLRIVAKLVANGAAALNVYVINLILFFAGVILAVFDWPRCFFVWPLLCSIVIFSLVIYELLITVLPTPFESMDADLVEEYRSRVALWRWFRNRPVGEQLLLEQVAFNVMVIILLVLGVMLGGANDDFGSCTA